ncbi:hypothetical protein HW555_013059 [Spodoptera exigua]|uniref:SGTA homodimerisation domain-containing protein n=1 Tax=Spodoptera exigua TaxID=7107 RepID=A0A835G416_SPOEX|nr:hypothetical protein HW555_013059 [Spodoptera exigua]
MSDIKIVAASIVNFLKRQLEGDSLSVDSRESVEVGVQCIETAFELGPEDAARGVDLLQLVRAQVRPTSLTAPPSRSEAEKLKNEARDFEGSVADCTAALGLQPDYGKAHSRLGLALTALERHREARAAYARAVQLEPENETYRQNLQVTDELLASHGERAPLDLGGLLQNPALLNMATEMLADPNMQNLISGLMSGAGGAGAGGGQAGGAGGMSALLEAGQALAQHMQAANPELVEQLRRQVRPPGPNPPQ